MFLSRSLNNNPKIQNSNKPVGEIKNLTVTTPGLFKDLFGLKNGLIKNINDYLSL